MRAEEQPRLSETVARGSGILAVGYIGTQVITLGAYAVLARLAPPETFGAFAAASILVAAGAFLSESGMTAALVQRAGAVESAAATATVSTFTGGLLLSLVALAVSPLVGLFFESDEIGAVAAALAGLLFFNAASVVPGALLQRRFSLRPRLVVDPLAALVLGVTSGIALAAGLGIWGLVVGAYASALARTASLWLLGGWLPRLSDASWATWKELATFARHIVATEGLRYSGDVATTAIVGRALGPAQLAYFRFGGRIAFSGAKLTSVGQYMLLPAFSRIVDDRDRFRRAFERALLVSVLVVFPIFAVFLALGEPIAVLLFGDTWVEAGQVLMALSLLAATGALGSVAAESVKAAGRPDVLPLAALLGVVLPIALMFPLLRFGAVGVGLAHAIGLGIATFYTLVRAAAVVGVPLGSTLKLFRAPAVGALGCAGVAFSLDRYVLDAAGHGVLVGLALLCVEILAGGLVYLLLVTMLSREARVELRAVWRLFALQVRPAHRRNPASGGR